MKKRLDKKGGRLRRAKRTRMRIRELRVPRLSVHRTPQHMYAQVIIGDDGGADRVVAQASTLDKALPDADAGNIAGAAAVGRLVAQRAAAAGIEAVAFDRSGYKFHGRVKALADAARESGLKF